MESSPVDPDPERDRNPYAAPGEAIVSEIAAPADAEDVPRQHLSAEASVRAVGILLLVEAGLATLFLIRGLNQPVTALPRKDLLGITAAKAAFLVVLPVMLGWGLAHLRRSTLLGGLLLYRLDSRKGRMIFSPLHQAIVAATPQVSPHNTVLEWVLAEARLVVSLFFLGALVVGI